MKRSTHSALLLLAVGAMLIGYAVIALAKEPTALAIKATCDKDVCIIKKADLEAVMASHNAHMLNALKCEGKRNEI